MPHTSKSRKTIAMVKQPIRRRSGSKVNDFASLKRFLSEALFAETPGPIEPMRLRNCGAFGKATRKAPVRTAKSKKHQRQR
jgi:hypothetical protein